MDQSIGEEDEDEDAPLMMVSYCHRHCRVDTERAALYSGADGLSIGKHGRMVWWRDLKPLIPETT